MGVAAAGLLLATAGCLEPSATSYSTASSLYRPQPAVQTVDNFPPPYQPSPYQPAPYQPPPLSPALTPQTTPVVGTNNAGSPPVRYLPAPQPTTSLLGPQRTDWKPGGGF